MGYNPAPTLSVRFDKLWTQDRAAAALDRQSIHKRAMLPTSWNTIIIG
jgi:hypothetical protein